jgi:alpha-ribazole phosphatase
MKNHEIHFIRHGLTLANMNAQYIGVKDVPVCDNGIKELQELRKNCKYPVVQKIFSSPLTRCIQTAKIIYPEMTPIIVENLKEMNFGDWEGKTVKELQNTSEYANWLENSGALKSPPKGESSEEFGQRIFNAFEKVVEDLILADIESIAIFSHGGVIMSLLTRYSARSRPQIEWMVKNGCGFSAQIEIPLWEQSKKIKIFGSVPTNISPKIDAEYKKVVENITKCFE